MKEKYVCDCCGGAINPVTMKCEFCGTQYETRHSMDILKVETYQNPVNTYTACVSIDDDDIRKYGAEHISEFAVKELSHELAKCIASNMVVDSRFDIYNFRHNVYGTIKMVKPVNNVDNWRIK